MRVEHDRWRDIETLLQSALQRPDNERRSFVQQACENDDALRDEVMSLLERDAAAAEFIETRAVGLQSSRAPSEPSPPTGPVKDLVGRTLTHYRIVGKLGSGGMGEVYAAEDVRLGRRVAIKLLLESFRRDPIALERLRREARAASSLNHPNICTIFDIGTYDGVPFVVMELLEGCSLATRLRGGAMSTDEAVPVCLGVLAALDALHSRRLVHRDIKPSNVFLTPHGAKLLDFGLAKSVAVSGDAQTVTGD